MKNIITKLIDLKSIITLLLVITLITIVLLNTAIKDDAIRTLFVSTISSVFTYYFTKNNKRNEEEL